MFGVMLKINTSEILQLTNRLRQLGDFSKPLNQCGIMMMRSIDKNFRDQGRPIKWKPLSPLTIELRRKGRRKRFAGQLMILVDTGRLRNSLIRKGSPGNIYKLHANSLQLGTNVEYAWLMQMGGRIIHRPPRHIRTEKTKKKKLYVKSIRRAKKIIIPPRPFLVVQEEDKKMIVRIHRDFIKNVINKGVI